MSWYKTLSRTILVACALGLVAPAGAGAYLSTRNISPFPRSGAIVGASWTSPRYGPPANQSGDILPTVWADDGNEYTIMDDGGTDPPQPGDLWRQSVARITGTPPNVQFSYVGNPNSPPPHTLDQIKKKRSLWQGPLGPYYSSGLIEANGVFFATEESDWNWKGNGLFTGLRAIAYSLDRGQHWADYNSRFPAPLGNLSWVLRGQGGVYRDGYVYAIATEREFNASRLIMGRSRPDVADLTNPARWQWVTGWTRRDGVPWAVFSRSIAKATAILGWASHITYPQMSYDSPLHRYLLSFTYSYAPRPPGMWQNGAELLILEAAHPWGPFSFVAHEPEFGPSNGYAPGIPVSWISRNGRDLWLKWSANFDGCAKNLDCSGGYGFNYRRLHLTLAGDH